MPALTNILRAGRNADARLRAVWAASRIDSAEARAAIRTALADKDETVRQAAIQLVSLWRDREAVSALIRQLKSPSPANQRVAAEALGRIGDKAAVPALLEAVGAVKSAPAGSSAERVLEHSLVYALIEIADREGTLASLKSGNPRVRRAALTVLDQMPGGGLEAGTVAKDLAAAHPALKETASWIVGRHPDWGTELAGLFREKLRAKEIQVAEQQELVRQLARLSRTAAVQDLLAEAVRDNSMSIASRRGALRAMAQSSLKQVPDAWTAALAAAIAGKEKELVREAVFTAHALPWGKQRPEKLIGELLRVGSDADMPAEVRLTALAAVPSGLPSLSEIQFDFLRIRLDSDQTVLVRTLAADVISRAKLTPPQLLKLTEVLKSVGPMEIVRLLQAYGQTADEKIGLALIGRFEDGTGAVCAAGSTITATAEEVWAAGTARGGSSFTPPWAPTRPSRNRSWKSCWRPSRPAMYAAARSSSTGPRPRVRRVTPSATWAAKSAPT